MSRKHAFLNDILKITSRFKEPCREVCGKKEKKKEKRENSNMHKAPTGNLEFLLRHAQ